MVISGVLVLTGIIIVGKAAYIMFGERTKWAEIAKTCIVESVPVPVNRGNIISSDGQLLATYVPEYKIYMDYNIYSEDSVSRQKFLHLKDSLFFEKLDSIAIGMNKVLPDKSTAWFKQRLLEGFNKRSRHWLIYPKRVKYFDYQEIQKIPFFNLSRNLTGLHADEQKKIEKPFGSLAARTLGDVDRTTGHGLTGLQKQYDSLLSGTPGMSHKVKTMNMYLPVVDQPAIAGADVHTTIDVSMQDFCEDALVQKLKEIDGMYGVAILMDVKTGDIKAMVNMERIAEGTYSDVRNYAVSQLMQPGSVFKTISITAALEAGKVDLNTTVDCSSGCVSVGGYIIKDSSHKSAKVISLREVLGYSSNVGVIKLITKGYGGSRASEQQFCDDVKKLGITEDMQLDIPGYTTAKIPSPQSMGEYWSASSMASMSIGYSTMVPPISLLAFYNGIANGGRMMRPRLVTHIVRNGNVIMDFPPRAIKERMCSQKTVHDITECLKWVVSKGLGGYARSPYFSAAGKTGTARVQEKDHAGEYLVTFAGFFPADNPRYSCVVCIRNKGLASGGGTCGPVFKQISEFVMSQGNRYTIDDHVDSVHTIPPELDFTNLLYSGRALSDFGFIVPSSWTSHASSQNNLGKVKITDNHAKVETKKTKSGIVPDLTGMGPRDALYLLEKQHMRVRLSGVGKVVSQSLPKGHVIKPNEQITLVLGCVDKYNLRPKPTQVVAEPPKQNDTEPQTEKPTEGQKTTTQSPHNKNNETAGTTQKHQATSPGGQG